MGTPHPDGRLLTRYRTTAVAAKVAAALLIGAHLAVAVPGAAAATPLRRVVPSGFMGVVADGPLVRLSPRRIDAEMALMARSGVESVRVPFYWGSEQPVASWPEVPHAPEDPWAEWADFGGRPTRVDRMDSLVLAAARHRLHVLPVVVGAPQWAAMPGAGAGGRPRDDRDYTNFLSGLARRYGPGGFLWRSHPGLRPRPIREWQIWNEINFPVFWWTDPPTLTYLTLLRASRAALRLVDPGARVVLAALADQSWAELRRIYDAGGRRLFDAVAINVFTTWVGDVVGVARVIRRVMVDGGDARKPLYVTETAALASWVSGPRGSPQAQVARMRRLFTQLPTARRRYGIAEVYWYTWLTAFPSTRGSFDFSGLRRISRNGTIHSSELLGGYRGLALRMEGCRLRSAGPCR